VVEPSAVFYALAFLAGVAGLTWELLWMHHAALALGVSAQGAALTLVAFSLGMAIGALAAGRWLPRKFIDVLRVWAALELAVGLLGQLLAPGFSALEQWDAAAWSTSPEWVPLGDAVGVLALLVLPSACMGATIPVFASVAAQARLSVARLYASNIAGAATGIVLASLVLIPGGGIDATAGLASATDLAVAAALMVIAMRSRGRADTVPASTPEDLRAALPMRAALAVAAATGFATFALEVAWFRSLRATFQATTESFALVLFAVLIALAIGGAIAPRLAASRRIGLGSVIAIAAALVLVSTPIVERLDLVAAALPDAQGHGALALRRLALTLAVLGPSMVAIGIGLPWCLEVVKRVDHSARLVAINTAGAVVGSLAAAWVLLPALGFARTAWMAGLALAIVAVAVARGRARVRGVAIVVVALLVAWIAASDVGRLRVQSNRDEPHRVVETREDPDATISVIEHDDGTRHLVIDGFYATGTDAGAHYMPWMGHLPMLMHPDPKQALVICFGTGQTANAVRQEGPEVLDVVDVSAGVLAMAPHFAENHGVLEDPRVRAHVMDGRAYLRRTAESYDVVTLEPMPPTFAGSNALYSVEFYRLVAARLRPGGVVAQWLPFHLVDPGEAASIAATFVAVFEDAHLWMDPLGTGILVGRLGADAGAPLLPGLQRAVVRDMTPREIAAALRYHRPALDEYAKLGEIITDDNQRLSYGYARMRWWGYPEGAATRYQHLLLDAIAEPGPLDAKLERFYARYPDPRSVE
jgi:spermidine synthase